MARWQKTSLDVQMSFNGEDMAQLTALLKDTPKKIPAILARVINRGLNTVRTHVTRIVAKELGLKYKTAGYRVRRIKATKENLTGDVEAGRWGWRYMAFRPIQTATGVKVKMRRSKMLKHAFLARMESGHPGVFLREGKARLPIREQFTASPTEAITAAGGVLSAKQAGAEMLSKRLKHEIDRVLKRRYRAEYGDEVGTLYATH